MNRLIRVEDNAWFYVMDHEDKSGSAFELVKHFADRGLEKTNMIFFENTQFEDARDPSLPVRDCACGVDCK